MSGATNGTAGRPSARAALTDLVGHARGPLGRGAFFLSMNQVIVSGLGFVFWIVVARSYDAASVGRATSLIAAAVFLAIISTLGLPYALVRQLAQSADPRRLSGVVLGSTAAAGFALGATGGALLALASPQYAFLIADPLDLLILASFVCAFSVEAGLEQVLVAARKTEWSTLMLVIFGALRLVGPLALPVGGARELIVFWAASMGAAVVVTLVVFVPRAVASIPAKAGGAPPAVRPLLAYAAQNHAATLLALAGPALLPAALIIALGGASGAGSAATFYIAYQVGSLLLVVSIALALVQFAEGSRPDSDWRANERRALRLGFAVVVPCAAAMVLLAPFILSFFGAHYVDDGANLLRLLAVAAIPAVPGTVLASRFRLAGDLRPPMLAAGLSSAVALGGAVVTLPSLGLVGAGAAVLAGQCVAAAVLALTPPGAKHGGAATNA